MEFNANATATSVPTNLNLGSTNAPNLAPSTYPITAGTYSYSKWIKGLWSGTFTRIENLQFWMSSTGPYVTGEVIRCSASTEGGYAGTTTYVAPTTTLDAQVDNTVPVADPSAANIGFTGVLAASLTTSTAGSNMSDFIVLQASITAAASAGATNQKEFRLQYDEV